jgi:hypothetical protein
MVLSHDWELYFCAKDARRRMVDDEVDKRRKVDDEEDVEFQRGAHRDFGNLFHSFCTELQLYNTYNF